MKRIAGSFTLLLAGLGGCVSFTAPPGQGEVKQTAEVRPFVGQPAGPGPMLPPPATAPTGTASSTIPPAPAPMPASPNWTMAPEHVPPPRADHTASRPLTPPSPMAGMKPAPLPGALASNTPSSPAPARAASAMPPGSPPPFASTPAPLPSLPPGMPVVTTPPSERVEKLDPALQKAIHTQAQTNQSETLRDPGALASPRPELPPTVTTPNVVVAPTTPAAPIVKTPNMTEIKPAPTLEPKAGPSMSKSGMPLVRLVNTKRITLNFEVKDVGPSGLSSVELWYTQDGKDWKKYDAPVQAQVYVVEVDEEGMYGFTLLARSGTGLAKDAPQPGDQPQVWVIVDLSKPDVQLNEVIPSLKTGQQFVTMKWKASDKNLGRQPITLSYAEKEEGPWKVIATGLDNAGAYTWEVPKGTPPRVLFRVDASDLAGNIGRAQSAKAVLMDNMLPTVSIVGVESNGGK